MPKFNDVFEKYEYLQKAYDNNGLYDSIRKDAINTNDWVEALKPMRTVVNRSVEFYVAKIFPADSIEVVAETEIIADSIDQVAVWSNFAGKKQLFLRNLSLFGDLFLKVNFDGDKVFYENINPQYVTEFLADSRGFLQWIRIDIPILVDKKRKTYTEFWTKEYFSVWVHGQDRNTPLRNLGEPRVSGFTAELGIDFVPFVHIKFKDTGDIRGKACTEHAIDKITEANRQATRLAQMLFRHNKPIWAVTANAVDSDGIALPAPKLSTGDGLDISFTDNSIIYLPGASKLEGLIPNINYGDALSVLNSMMNELEQDLPELKYYSLKEGDLSGKAISLLLGGALDRAREARSNFVQGIERANEIALTMGSFNDIFPSNIGSFEAGNFKHEILIDELFGRTLAEKAETLKALVDSGISLEEAMQMTGLSVEV